MGISGDYSRIFRQIGYGGEARALATRAVEHFAPIILVTGGFNKNPKTGKKESRAVQLAKLITEKYGVLRDKIIVIGKFENGSLLGNAKDLESFLKDNFEVLKLKKIGIVCPDFQSKRAKIMFDSIPYFEDNGIKLDWISVEKTLGKINPQYKKWIKDLYNSSEAKINKKMEAQGVKDFKKGKYKTA